MAFAVILPASLSIPRPSNRSLSSYKAFTGQDLFLPFSISSSAFTVSGGLASQTAIRMGGGPRTYPGGVTKWQWKRMQLKKAKQILKTRLSQERQLYEMRKRAELKIALSELERPWELVERAPKLFSVSADEQIKALAHRFQRPDGFDLWSERDGPCIFRSSDDLTVRIERIRALSSTSSMESEQSVPPKCLSQELGLADSRKADGKMMDGVQGWLSRNGNGITKQTRQAEAEAGLRIEKRGMAGSLGRRSYGSIHAGSRMLRREKNVGFDRSFSHGGRINKLGSDRSHRCGFEDGEGRA